MANAMTDMWLKELDESFKKQQIQNELNHRVINDPEYKEAQEKFKAICEGLNERRKIAAKEENDVFKKVMDRVAKEMGLKTKDEKAEEP